MKSIQTKKQTSKKNILKKIRKAVFRKANRLRSILKDGKRAMQMAWRIVKIHMGLTSKGKVTFKKKDGSITTRTIQSLKTLGGPTPPKNPNKKYIATLVKFVDVAKLGGKRSPVISFHLNQIISIT